MKRKIKELEDFEIKDFIEDYLNQLGFKNIKIELKWSWQTKHIMSYNNNENILNVCGDNLRSNASHENIEIKNFIIISLAHELGHIEHSKSEEYHILKDRFKNAIDKKNKIKIRIDLEEKAWELGQNFISGDLMELFNTINEKNINRYKVAL